jgi:hypothetical protein
MRRGYAQTKPVTNKRSRLGRAQNRRVELHCARKLCPTPPLPLMTRLTWLLIDNCTESQVARVCDEGTNNAWSVGCRLGIRDLLGLEDGDCDEVEADSVATVDTVMVADRCAGGPVSDAACESDRLEVHYGSSSPFASARNARWSRSRPRGLLRRTIHESAGVMPLCRSFMMPSLSGINLA